LLELLKMAKLAARPRGRRRRRATTQAGPNGDAGAPPREPVRPIMQLCTGDVDLGRAPRAAVEDFLAHREPPREQPRGRPRRGRESTREREHRWMLERE
jgi:hypothetical protein